MIFFLKKFCYFSKFNFFFKWWSVKNCFSSFSKGEVNYAIPSTVFGILSILAGIFDFLLPETGQTPLPETIEDVESMKR